MKKLITDVIHSIQHYRIYLFDADFHSGLEYIIAFINSIPWKWLRDFIGTIIMFLIFLSWRTKTIIKQKMIDGVMVTYEKKISLWDAQLEKNHTFYLPSSMWKWEDAHEGWKKTMPLRILEAKQQIDKAAGRGTSTHFFSRAIHPVSAPSAVA